MSYNNTYFKITAKPLSNLPRITYPNTTKTNMNKREQTEMKPEENNENREKTYYSKFYSNLGPSPNGVIQTPENIKTFKKYWKAYKKLKTQTDTECWKIFLEKNFFHVPDHILSHKGHLNVLTFIDYLDEVIAINHRYITPAKFKSQHMVKVQFFGNTWHIYSMMMKVKFTMKEPIVADGAVTMLDEFCAFLKNPYWSYPDLWINGPTEYQKYWLASKLAKYSGNSDKPWLFKKLTHDFDATIFHEMNIGAEAPALVQESMRINGPEIARNDAMRMYNNDLSSTPTTQYRMDSVQLTKYHRYTGHQIMSNSKKRTSNDHLFLAVAREQLRNQLDSIFPHNTDFTTTLHVGSSVQDVKRWYSHSGHDFLFNLLEDKDISRNLEDLIRLVGIRIVKQNLPLLLSRSSSDIRIKFQGFQELVDMFELGKRKRIYFSQPTKLYTTLIFEDSLYSMSPEQFASYWLSSNAVYGYATMFFPDKFYNDYVVESQIYRYEEYIPLVEDAEDVINYIWPTVLALQPMFPVKYLVEEFRNFLSWCLTTGWSVFSGYLTRAYNDGHLIETFFAAGFDIIKFKPIFKCIMGKIRHLLHKYLVRVRVVWKHGFSNGYDHRYHTWAYWLNNRRIRISEEEYIDSEITSVEGEMFLIKFYRSRANNPIATTFSLPPHRVAVLVADLETSYNIGSSKYMGLDNLQYFAVSSNDWFKLLNWGLAEPVGSLTFAVVISTLNRIRGGLSLSSNTMVESMDVFDKNVTKMALSCYMEIIKRQEVITNIENDPNLLEAYESNIKKFLKDMGKTVLTVMTGGLCIPLAFLYKWMISTYSKIEFVKYPVDPEPKIFPARQRKIGETKPELAQIGEDNKGIVKPNIMNFFHEELKTKRICDFCQLYHESVFSSTGVPADGQIFRCCNSESEGKHIIDFDSYKVGTIMSTVMAAESFHESINAKTLVQHIKNFKHWLEKQENGFTYETTIRAIVGGPGTGKTEVIKALVSYYEKRGQDCGILVPFSDLMKDYINTSVLGEEKNKTFAVKTTWYATSFVKVDYLIVDEMTVVDWDYIQTLAVFTSAKCIILVGDAQQTALIPGKEGIDATNPLSGLDWSNIPTHELVKNFRLDAWRVRLLNHLYGYSMIPVRNDSLIPQFISKTEYLNIRKANPFERELVFSHASAPEIYGCESSSDKDDGNNMSVRSCQGKTYSKSLVAVTCTQLDAATIEAHGMLNVAISRSKTQMYFVHKDGCQNDPVVEKVKRTLYCDSQERFEFIAQLPLPKPVDPPQKFKFTEEQKNYDDVLRVKFINKEIESTTLGDKNVEGLSFPDSIPVDKLYYQETTSQPVDLYEFFKTQFQFCIIDSLKTIINDPKVDREFLECLTKIYESDELMGRITNDKVNTGTFVFKTKALKIVDSKRLLPIKPFIELLEKHGYNLHLFSESKKLGRNLKYMTKLYKSEDKTDIFLNLNEEHVTLADVKTYDIHHPFEDGRIIFSLKDDTAIPEFGNFFRYAMHLRKTGKKDEYIYYDEKKAKFFLNGKLAAFEVNEDSNIDDLQAGYESKLLRVPKVDLSRIHTNLALNYCNYSSSWMEKPNTYSEKSFVSNTKLRAGTDCFRLAPFIDPSGAWLRTSALNEFGGVKGITRKTNVKINWEGFIYRRTKSGLIKPRRIDCYRSINVGMGNHYNNTPEESLIASQRIGRVERKPKLTQEAKQYVLEIARDVYQKHWRKDYIVNKEAVNYIIYTALRAIKQRNYNGRFDAEIKKSFTLSLTCSNKDQFKPIKNHKLDVFKGGQVLLQSPARVNLQFISWMRVNAFLFKDAMCDDTFTDDYESPIDFRLRMSKAIQLLPPSSRVAIADGEEWDSQQNPVTLEIEKELCRLFGATENTIKEYFLVRGNLPFIMHGIFKGTTNGEKGSGFLDTKLGNTKLATVFGSRIIHGLGPKVVGVKGDDYAKLQTGLRIDEHEVIKIKKLCGMKLNITIGDGGEFCGNSISRKGLYPSITRMAMKAMAMKAKSIDKFYEKQIALRDKIKEIMSCGLAETIKYSAYAEQVSENYVSACFDFLNSMAHINGKQWLQITKARSTSRYYLPSANCYNLI